jgi:hypothetical protein
MAVAPGSPNSISFVQQCRPMESSSTHLQHALDGASESVAQAAAAAVGMGDSSSPAGHSLCAQMTQLKVDPQHP